MNRKNLTTRRALLHRQTGELLRYDAAYQDELAREIDGELSAAEKEEISIRLKWLSGLIEKATMESRLARLEG